MSATGKSFSGRFFSPEHFQKVTLDYAANRRQRNVVDTILKWVLASIRDLLHCQKDPRDENTQRDDHPIENGSGFR